MQVARYTKQQHDTISAGTCHAAASSTLRFFFEAASAPDIRYHVVCQNIDSVAFVRERSNDVSPWSRMILVTLAQTCAIQNPESQEVRNESYSESEFHLVWAGAEPTIRLGTAFSGAPSFLTNGMFVLAVTAALSCSSCSAPPPFWPYCDKWRGVRGTY